MRQQPSLQGNRKPHERLAAPRGVGEHNDRGLKTCVGRWKLRVEAGCSRGRRCLLGWDFAGEG